MNQQKSSSPISVMLVDDESLYIDEIKLLYSFRDHGFDLVCTASNGKDALEKFHRYSPQVVITDIEMPLLGGIDLCREIRKISSRTKLLFLTAYDEFNYIKSALHVSAFDYLLKYELSAELLCEKMEDIRQQLEEEAASQSEHLSSAVFSLFQRAENQVSRFLTDLLPGTYLYVVAGLKQPFSLAGPSPSAGLNGCEALLADGSECGCFPIGDAQLLFLFDPRGVSSEAALQSALASSVRAMGERLGPAANRFVFYTVPSPLSLADFHRLYFSRLGLFSMEYFHEADAPVSLLAPLPAAAESEPAVSLEALYHAVLRADQSLADEAVAAIFHALKRSRSYPLLLSTLQKLYYHLKDASAAVLTPVSPPSECYSLSALQQWLSGSVRALIQEKSALPSKKLSAPVRRALAYINEHLSIQELSLEAVAEQAHLSPGQLNRLLKREAGITVYQYIKSARIRRAKQLLSSTACPVYEIAQQCGYGSSQHFSQLFHEATGKSPKAFRREHEQEI